MSNQVTVRELSDDEWEVLARLRLEALQEYPGMYGAALEVEGGYSAEEWKSWLKPRRQVVFGMFDGDHAVGIAALITDQKDPNAGEIIALYLQPRRQKQRLSKLLYQACFEWAKAHDAWTRLIVSHRVDNEWAIQTSLSHGFSNPWEEAAKWPDGAELPVRHYELDLQKLRKTA